MTKVDDLSMDDLVLRLLKDLLHVVELILVGDLLGEEGISAFIEKRHPVWCGK